MDAKTLCLGVLALGDASGYEIRKQFEEGPFAHFHDTSFGSIYPALTKLTADGFVTCTNVAQDGKPDKKVYAITDTGRAAFRKALHKSPTADRIRSESIYMFFFADLLDSTHLDEIYDTYLAYYRGQVARLEAIEGALNDPDHADEILSKAMGESARNALRHGCGVGDLPKTVEVPHREFTRGLGMALYNTIVRYLEDNRDLLFSAAEGETSPNRAGGEK